MFFYSRGGTFHLAVLKPRAALQSLLFINWVPADKRLCNSVITTSEIKPGFMGDKHVGGCLSNRESLAPPVSRPFSRGASSDVRDSRCVRARRCVFD